MSRKPYVIQDDSPNLVIVPTEMYKPCPKKTKLDTSGFNKLPVNNKSVSGLVNKADLKISVGAKTRNNNVLIDVTKVTKQQSSWASNFLQSIGGSVKPSRLYHSLGTNYLISRNENAQTNATQSLINREKIEPKLNNENTQPKANKEAIHEKKNRESIKLNTDLKLLQANNEAREPKVKTVSTQLNSTTESAHVKANKEVPRLKSSEETISKNNNKGIPQPKFNKEAMQQKSHTETNRPNTVTRISQLNEANKEIHRSKTTQSNPITEKPKAIDYKKCTDQIADKETNEPKTKKSTVKISPIKPPTTATPLLKREDVKLNHDMLWVTGKKPLDSQNNNNYTRHKSLNEELNTRTSPIKSVVTKINKYQNPDHQFYKESDYYMRLPENQCVREADNDLRSRLKRKLPKNYNNYTDEHHGNKYCMVSNSKGFVPNENLIISFNAESDSEQAEKKQPLKTRMQKQKTGGKKCKKIKLEINIIFQNTGTTDDKGLDNNCKNENFNDFNENNDLSFLDDFNVDEIVESLNDCQSSKPKMKTDMNTNQYINKTDNKRRGSSTIDGRETDGCSTVQTSRDELPSDERCSNQDSAIQFKIPEQKTFHQNAFNTNDSNLGKDIKNIPPNENEVQIVNGLVKLSTKETDDKQNDIADTIQMEVNESNSVKIFKKQIDESLPDVKHVCFDDEANTSIAQSKSTQKEVKSFTASEKNGVSNPNENTNSVLKDDSKTHQVKIIKQDKQIQNFTEQQSNFQCSKIENNNRIKEDKRRLIEDKNLKATELSSDIKTNQTKDNIIITEGPENAKVKGQQYLKENTIIDLTNDLGVLLDDKSDDVIFVDTSTPNLIEIDTEPILILDTNYDFGMGLELEPSSDEKEKKASPNGSDSNAAQLTNKRKTPIETVEKLFNKDNKMENGLIAENDNVILRNNSSENNETVKKLLPGIQNAAKTNIMQTKDGIQKTINVKSQNARPNIQPEPQDNVSQTKSKVIKGNEIIHRSASNFFVKDLFARSLEAKLGSKYNITDIVHQGRFSTLYCCEHENQSKKIIKVLRFLYDHHHFGSYKEDMLIKLQEGVQKDNQNCVSFFKGFSVYSRWCFVMEYFPKNLHEALSINKKSFHIDKVQHLSRQLVTAVTILRNNNIIHSDIKPHHILLDESETRLKLCGFDDAFYYCNDGFSSAVGTVNYRAPELIMGYAADYRIDVWSTALVMYEMATNKQLFPGRFNNEILYKQLCTLGNMPCEMIERSVYSGSHFTGTTFVWTVGPQRKERIFIKEFMRSNVVHSALFSTYDFNWVKAGGAQVPGQPARDRKKLTEFENLLYQMLVIHPRRRITIEFVFANPFIY